ncbi:MAG: chromosome segregation protein SMC [Inquilinaceae bacterium]
MLFTKLRLSGFKSFVDATELAIEPGVTGIVGPNGCGKSNLVEALRWVMGENSAKRMRGGEMDDVIFGGTADRPARNLAEVTLTVDNTSRTAPAMFNDSEDLEVSRRIERRSGSDYRVNGKLVRARDVQLLFQDNASGSASPALVSQGRVGALISAKPTDRRSLLEEAAGITGLHSRRHEAELRLRAAETNLTRLDDIIAAMETQLAGLKKQARQAARYRNMSEAIRSTEAELLHLQWRSAQERLRAARAAHEANEHVVRDRMTAVTQATTAQAEAAADLPPLRDREAAASAGLHRLVVERDGLTAEAARTEEAIADSNRRLAQIDGDLSRERALGGDAAAALTRLEAEASELTAACDGEREAEDTAGAAVARSTERVESLDADLTVLTEKTAADEAERQTLVRRVAELEARATSLARRAEDTAAQRHALQAELDNAPAATAADATLEAAEVTLQEAQSHAERLEKARHAAEAEHETAREALQSAETALAKLNAEADALRAVLSQGDPDLFPPMIDAVTVEDGYEAAFGAAFGDEVGAPLDTAAPVHWRTLPALDPVPLPKGAAPLSGRVDAPDALVRRLSHIGIVDDEETGRALAPYLQPGQQLVTRDGGQWRWDGYSVLAGAPTAAAARLTQRNRLAQLDADLGPVRDLVDAARRGGLAAAAKAKDAMEAERAARQSVQAAFAAVNAARDHRARLTQEESGRRSRLDALVAALDAVTADREDTEAALAAARDALAAVPSTDGQRQRVTELRAAVAEARNVQAVDQATLAGLRREAAARRTRMQAIATEQQSWRERAAGTAERLAELDGRAIAERAALERLAGRPAEIAAQKDVLQGRIAQAERDRKEAADSLAVAETRLADANRALKSAEAALAVSREARVRAEGDVRAEMTAQQAVTDRIAERLNCSPDRVQSLTGLAADAPLPDEAQIQTKLDRLLRERNGMGAVNLRAEVEAGELNEQIAAMIGDRDDLLAAIARLRHGIASLNREARERLVASFETVNGHFQDLFTRLFGGGRAHLELTQADDPLDAGLEVFASPPGKRLQTLSLLSGGEQALTALSILFAVFLTNPAPICVLDEVDAPLDDANVDRFCSLLEDLAGAGTTRFLIITHHRMTMSRVDRLFGVTMSERGVSQLVSVDLQRAEMLRQTA